MSVNREPAFIGIARTHLAVGNPSAALEIVYSFSEQAYVKGKPHAWTQRYWQLRALACYLTGRIDDGHNALKEAEGMTMALFSEYEVAFISYATRSPRFKKRKARHEDLLKQNVKLLIAHSQELPIDPLQHLHEWMATPAI